MAELLLDGQSLTLEQVAEVAYAQPDQIHVALAPDAVERMKRSRQVVEDVLTRGETVYGINTGFGAMSSVTIAPDQVDQLQANLVRSHAAGTGDHLEAPTVRAMMLLRANTLAKGVSGIRVEVVQRLLDLLNLHITPAIPEQGSLGASGDLAPLAHLALVLMGEGEVLGEEGRRSILPAAPVLAEHKLTTLTLKAKEGLALLNGTQMMNAVGILTLLKAEELALAAEIAGTMTIEAVMGSARPFSEQVAAARPHPGHGKSAAIARKLIKNSEIMEAHRDCAKVQDPYSLRCIPQVHGMAWDVLARVRETLTIEANAATDNPLVFPDGEIVSQGNFHGEPVAMVLDMLGMALAELGSISERRIDKLMNPAFSNLPAFLTGEKDAEGLNSGFMIVHYTAASLVSENKGLAHPAIVDSIPTSNDKEDHVSMGSIAARKARTILKHTRWVLAAEMLAAAQGLEFHDNLKPADGVQAARQEIRRHVEPLGRDRVMSAEVEKVASLIDNGDIHEAVRRVVGELP